MCSGAEADHSDPVRPQGPQTAALPGSSHAIAAREAALPPFRNVDAPPGAVSSLSSPRCSVYRSAPYRFLGIGALLPPRYAGAWALSGEATSRAARRRACSTESSGITWMTSCAPPPTGPTGPVIKDADLTSHPLWQHRRQMGAGLSALWQADPGGRPSGQARHD